MRERLYPIPRYVTRWLVAGFLALAACGEAPETDNLTRDGGVTALGLRGSPLPEPLAKPPLVLTKADGRQFDFVRETDGKVTLLFFGYTHCPDVCPLHMANIAAVMKKMPWSAREMIRVVFVTTDPERDTPARLTEWLGGFDASFIGLYGERALVDSAQRSLGIAPATRQEAAPADSSEYLVGHAAQVFAFGRDNVARVAYPFGTRQGDWAHDLPRLVAQRETPGEQAAAAPPAAGGSLGSRATLAIAPPVVAVAADGRSGALYLNVMNGSSQPDTLHNVSIIGGAMASLHVTTTAGGAASMQPVASVAIPAGGRLEMRPGGVHVMLEGAPEPMRPGSAAAVELHFARRGRVTAIASIVAYTQLDSVLTLARAALTR